MKTNCLFTYIVKKRESYSESYREPFHLSAAQTGFLWILIQQRDSTATTQKLFRGQQYSLKVL